eukprot:813804-Amorphochlora_amoeboformis.AAC.1
MYTASNVTNAPSRMDIGVPDTQDFEMALQTVCDTEDSLWQGFCVNVGQNLRAEFIDWEGVSPSV